MGPKKTATKKTVAKPATPSRPRRAVKPKEKFSPSTYTTSKAGKKVQVQKKRSRSQESDSSEASSKGSRASSRASSKASSSQASSSIEEPKPKKVSTRKKQALREEDLYTRERPRRSPRKNYYGSPVASPESDESDGSPRSVTPPPDDDSSLLDVGAALKRVVGLLMYIELVVDSENGYIFTQLCIFCCMVLA